MPAPLRDTLAAAARGERAAIDTLLADTYPQVRRMVHDLLARDFRPGNRWIGAMFSTNDIVQDVFLGVITSLEGFTGDHDAEFHRWVATQIRNRIVDRLRFHRAQRRDARRDIAADASGGVPLPGREPTPSHCASLDERALLFERALTTMNERERALWELRFEQERSFADIAAAMGYSDAESARSVFRALRAKLTVRLRRLGIEQTGDPGA
jgi:RNA polymerase sigma factor (sigma-70 family)